MSLKKNILASYATQIYVTLVGILILPLYLKYMGAEAYGLVGFFTMLQAWFNLLDMGLTPTVARETARFRGGATDAQSYLRLLRGLQLIFCAIALLGGGVMFAFSGAIAERWLNVQTLPLAQVELALQLMAVGVALRWMSGLYRGCISGAEHLVWLGGFNALIASLRFLGVMPILIWIDSSPKTFFIYQTSIAIIEFAGLFLKAKKIKPKLLSAEFIGWAPKTLTITLRENLGFSMSIAFTSSAWVIVSHTDKLLLSKFLSLSDYGYFTLATLAASAVLLITGPISSALVPKMTRLQAENKEKELILLYCNATQLGTAIATSACMMLVFFPEEIIFSWTGDKNIALHVAPILQAYAIGNFLIALATFPYDLQLVKGDMKKHLQGNIIFIFFWIPSIAWSTFKYQAIGAAYTWLVLNALYFLIWLPLVHHRFMKNFHWKWILQDIAPIFLTGIFIALITRLTFNMPSTREGNLLFILTIGLLMTTLCLLLSTPGKKLITVFSKKI